MAMAASRKAVHRQAHAGLDHRFLRRDLRRQLHHGLSGEFDMVRPRRRQWLCRQPELRQGSARQAPRRRWAGTLRCRMPMAASASPSRMAARPRSTALTITGKLERPVTDRQDQVLTFTSMGSGVYTAPATPQPRRLGSGDRCQGRCRSRLSQDLPLHREGLTIMTLPCCTIDGEYFQPFKLEGEDAERWTSTAGPGLKRIEFLVPQANRPQAMAADRERAAEARRREIGARQSDRPPRRGDLCAMAPSNRRR